MRQFVIIIWNNTPLDEAILHRDKATPHSDQHGALQKVIDLLRQHIEEWDLMDVNEPEPEDIDIKEMKERLHTLSPDIRNIIIIRLLTRIGH